MHAAPDEPPPLLDARDLSVRLGSPPVHAVNRIQFLIQPGEIVGIAGESGSGKSVTALSLTRLIPPDARAAYQGTVRLAGVPGNLLTMGERSLRRIRGGKIGYIFQEPSACFNPVFTIRAHMEEILRVHGIPASRRPEAVRTSLREVAIPADAAHLDAYPAEFSGGMLQRTAIACALLGSPQLLVADEPTTALDTSTQKRVVDLLARLNRELGMAVLFISHDLGLLRQIATRLLIMKEGVIVEEGPTEAVVTTPKDPYTRDLISAVPKLRR